MLRLHSCIIFYNDMYLPLTIYYKYMIPIYTRLLEYFFTVSFSLKLYAIFVEYLLKIIRFIIKIQIDT